MESRGKTATMKSEIQIFALKQEMEDKDPRSLKHSDEIGEERPADVSQVCLTNVYDDSANSSNRKQTNPCTSYPPTSLCKTRAS